ncbi:MAG TPA: DUF5947 family protein [Candidatus Sulfotelmatobacter sp.]|jgi:hypothetical protein|nr:DUF5947 family protein [Candidatus Sulfotelmatobacter sp.]
MGEERFSQSTDGFGRLRQLARRERRLERCELCSVGLRADHPHLIDVAQRKLLCTCEACAILFSGQGVKFKRVPRRVRSLPRFNLSDAEWNGLMVPINMAFFFRSSLEDRVIALYPSPAGATESLLALESWNDIVGRNPILNEMESDVEGLLVNRLGYSRGYSAAEYYLLPIDECYKLVGLIRMHWKGLSGGTEVWKALGEFFTDVKARSVEVSVEVKEASQIEEESHA